jgi:hypothetical protein
LPQPAVNGPSSPVLHGVTAVASDNVWAVGENEEVPGLGITTLIEHWNGSAWSIVPSPTPGAYPALNAVAARSASDVYAVGFNQPSINGGVQQGLILRLERQHLVHRHRSHRRHLQPAVRSGDPARRRQRVGGRHQQRQSRARPQPPLTAGSPQKP